MQQLNITNNYQPQDEILTSKAIDFLTAMVQEFSSRRNRLLELRKQRQRHLNAGALPGFCDETIEIRGSDWQVAAIPSEAQDRRTEIPARLVEKWSLMR